MKTYLALALAASLAVGFTATTLAQDTGNKQGERPAKAPKPDRPAREGGKGDAKAGKAAVAKVGEAAPNFTLKTTDGKDWSLTDAKGKVVVLEWVNPECPVCVRVMSDGTVANALKGAKEQYPDVVFVAVNSSASRKSSLDATAKYLKDNKIEIPALLDSDGAVGKMYGARTTPHCYVIDANGTLVYQGAIDDNQSGGGKTNYVVNALTQLKKGEKVSPSETKPYGCSVKY
ncbi:MAG: redoxin domain-containing protein [Planctomycetaceae bacterium]|jgi:peroxiredoxin|nr:redoxin domain-containing protein [Planctomycetaceae bacterium]